MDDLKFNIYAFAAPSSKAEYSALLDEALRLMDELGEQIACFERTPEALPASIAGVVLMLE